MAPFSHRPIIALPGGHNNLLWSTFSGYLFVNIVLTSTYPSAWTDRRCQRQRKCGVEPPHASCLCRHLQPPGRTLGATCRGSQLHRTSQSRSEGEKRENINIIQHSTEHATYLGQRITRAGITVTTCKWPQLMSRLTSEPWICLHLIFYGFPLMT